MRCILTKDSVINLEPVSQFPQHDTVVYSGGLYFIPILTLFPVTHFALLIATNLIFSFAFQLLVHVTRFLAFYI